MSIECAGDILPRLFLNTYQKYGTKKIAMRQKTLGIWQVYTWKDSYENVKQLCFGLVSLGMKHGDKVAIIGDNDPQCYWIEFATQSGGGILVPVYTDSSPSEMQYILAHSDSEFVFAKDQEQVDKLLSIKDDLPKLKKVIYWDDKGMSHYDDPILASFEEIQKLGSKHEEKSPVSFEQLTERVKEEDLALILYTSGTTGLPKSVMLSHKNLIASYNGWAAFKFWLPDDNYVSFLPLAWIPEHIAGVVPTAATGMCVNFPEGPETVKENIREIGPQLLFYSARQLESEMSMIQVKMKDTKGWKRVLYELFMPVGYKMTELCLHKQSINPFWRILYVLGEVAVFRAMRDSLGLLKIRCCFIGGTLLSPSILRFFQSIGVSAIPLYGLSECPIHTVRRREDINFESVGHPSLGAKIRISEEGEILVRGENLFIGYYKDPDTTAAYTSDGWFRTGDAGYIDENGYLIFWDRLQDLVSLADGTKFAPQYVEVRLRFSPYIKDVMALGGEDKPYVACIINIDFDNVGRWAEEHHITYTTFADLSQKPEVYGLIKDDIEKLNKTMPVSAQIKKYVLLYKEFDPDEAELTRSRKLRRSFVMERYKSLVEAIYQDKAEVTVEATVTYRDGRTGKLVTPVHIQSVE